MEKAIQQVHPRCPMTCSSCGRAEGVKVFMVRGLEDYIAFCSGCAREVIEGLANAFPGDELPTWFSMMNKLSSANRPDYEYFNLGDNR